MLNVVISGVRSGLCILCVLGIFGGIVAQTNYYVSPTGNDGNDGSAGSPFATIAKARDVVKGKTGNVNVYLRNGVYTQATTLTFDATCSGSGGNIVYQAYPGEQPIISGGQQITGWTVHDAAKNIYKATGVNFNFRQLYVNNKKAVRSRWPNVNNSATYPQIGLGGFSLITGYNETVGNWNLQVAAANITNWNNFNRSEIHQMAQWTDNILHMESFTVTGSTAFIKIKQPEDAMYFYRDCPATHWGPENDHYYFENAMELIDAEGEWYLDQTANILYYKLRSGENMATASVIAPKLATVVKVMGTIDNPVHNIWFKGIVFMHSTFLRPSDSGYVTHQATQYYTATPTQLACVPGPEVAPTAGVFVAYANKLRFERNVITFMGGTGIAFNNGTSNNLFLGNVITNVSGIGINVCQFKNPTDTRERCTNDSIENNYIYNVTTDLQGGIPIACGYPTSIRIEHNEVAYCNYSGISVGWGWSTSSNAMSNNIISYNYVHDCMQVLNDGGPMYTLSAQPNSIISNNWFNDGGGIYLDQGTTGYTITNNVAAGCGGNAPAGGNVIANWAATNQQSVKDNAGLQTAYKDIKSLATAVIPVNNAVGKISGITINATMRGIRISHTMPCKVNVVDARGRVVQSQFLLQTGESNVSMPEASGMYMIIVSDKFGSLTQKSIQWR